jgi:hypothetical protein
LVISIAHDAAGAASGTEAVAMTGHFFLLGFLSSITILRVSVATNADPQIRTSGHLTSWASLAEQQVLANSNKTQSNPQPSPTSTPLGFASGYWWVCRGVGIVANDDGWKRGVIGKKGLAVLNRAIRVVRG